jgi:hypothetical protein
MMTATAFDTLKFAKRLREAGFTEQQAEALAAAALSYRTRSTPGEGAEPSNSIFRAAFKSLS